MAQFYPKTNTKITYNPERTLTEIANILQTDKGTLSRDLVTWANAYPTHHCWHYTSIYEKYMDSYRDKEVKFMEIGICDKRFPFASPKMWLEYFKNVDLYSIDNFWGNPPSENSITNILNIGTNFIYADQGSPEDWDFVVNQIGENTVDFIVEDGSHWPNHVMYSLYRSIDILKTGGYYFMEDIQNPLKSRGWYRYDNADILLEFQNWSNDYKSSYIDLEMANHIKNNYELTEIVLDPNEINYLIVFKKL